jgi:signal transduction histidine kinase
MVDQDTEIPLALREQVVERFWRGRAQHRIGAGLGLAIVRDIMTAHARTVRIEDNAGGGAMFVLEFGKHSAPRSNGDEPDR